MVMVVLLMLALLTLFTNRTIMERIEVNVQTGEIIVIQLTQEEIDAILANQPTEPITE